ncbi:MAG: hypothetical protein ABI634_11050 [Acidobacteriota bacterium]
MDPVTADPADRPPSSPAPRVGARPSPSRRFVVAMGLLMALGAFVIHLALEREFARLQVFSQANVLFDADPNEVLDTLATGGGGRQGFIHPGIRVFFTAPIKVAALAISKVSAGTSDTSYWRRRLALLAAPTSAALFYVVLLNILLRIGVSSVDSCVLTLLAFLSFSQLLFGSIPESFPVSNLAVAVAFLLFVVPPNDDNTSRAAAWVAVGVFAAGITITNIVPVAILLWLDGVAFGVGVVRSCLKTAILSLVAVGVILSVNVVTNRAAGIQSQASSDTTFVTRFASLTPRVVARKFLTFPAVLVNTIVAPMPRMAPDAFARSISARYPFR